MKLLVFTMGILLIVVFNSFALAEKTEGDIILEVGLPEITDEEMPFEYLTTWSGAGFEAEKVFLNEIVGDIYPNLTIEPFPTESADLVRLVNTRLVAGNSPPIAHCSGGYFLDNWVREDVLVDMTDYWIKYDLEELIPLGIANLFKFNDKYYGIPTTTGQQNILWWNKNVFEEINVPKPPYETWDEFFKAADMFNDQADIPFYVDGLSPSWLAFERGLVLAATKYGVELYEDILNGKASHEQFEKLLLFNKKLKEIANVDYVSENNISGIQGVISRGEGALTMQGVWGISPFSKIGLKLDEDYGMTYLPGHKIFTYITMGLTAFKGSNQEEIAKAIAVTGALKETQLLVAPVKGEIPSRMDISADMLSGDFDRLPVAKYSVNFRKETVAEVPRVTQGLPGIVASDYASPYSSYLADEMELGNAVNELFKLQQKYQEYFTIKWDFSF
jgi:ABC-type glycerol-3-phosphate transport system substrate-binding protein